MDKVACIGSRDISHEKTILLEQIGEWLAGQDVIVSSGNATGSDQAFARGANRINPERVRLHLPWSGYEQHAIVPGNQIRCDFPPKVEGQLREVAEKHHPNWQWLGEGVRRLMIRNAAIVCGSQVCLALLNHAKKCGGGTGHGWRIAEGRQIPVLDLSAPVSLQDVKEFVSKSLEVR